MCPLAQSVQLLVAYIPIINKDHLKCWKLIVLIFQTIGTIGYIVFYSISKKCFFI